MAERDELTRSASGDAFPQLPKVSADAQPFVPKARRANAQPTATNVHAAPFVPRNRSQKNHVQARRQAQWTRQPTAEAGGGSGDTFATPNRRQTSGKVLQKSFFMSEELRQELKVKQYMKLAQLGPEADPNFPRVVYEYHSVVPLESGVTKDSASVSFGVHTQIVKGVGFRDGRAYALCYIDGSQVIPSSDLFSHAKDVVERWKPLRNHPHLCGLHDAFISKEFGGMPALYLAHEYHPKAVSLAQAFLHNTGHDNRSNVKVTEKQLWHYAIQMATLLQAVHEAGLSLRPGGLHPTKVLLTSKGRLRVSMVGILDVLARNFPQNMRVAQKQDLVGLGRLLLSLASGSMTSASVERAAQYSADMQRLIAALLTSMDSNGLRDAKQLMMFFGDRVYGVLEDMHSYCDDLTQDLSAELENGRISRLLMKLNMVLDRPDDDIEPGWSETGDRYLLKLFHDFVFHHVDEDGAVNVEWGGMVEALNKLDAGVQEEIVLMSRDGSSLLIVSYADIRRCIESSYNEIVQRSRLLKSQLRKK